MLVFLRDGSSDSCACCHSEIGVADHASVSQGRIIGQLYVLPH